MLGSSKKHLLERLGARLTTPLLPGAYAELFNPLWGDGMRAKVEAIVPEGDKAVSLVLRPNHRWRGAMAGQYLRLGVDIQGVRHYRNYSLTSSSQTLDRQITVTVQRLVGGLVSNYINDQLRVGDLVFLSEPAGEFVLAGSEPVLLITAGSGVTPAMGLQRTLAESGSERPLAHWHFARQASSSLFAQERQLLAQSLQWPLKESYTGAGDAHFSLTQLEAFCPDWRQRRLYVCGPRALVEAVQQVHREQGGQGALVTEFFEPPTFVASGETSAVKFVASGKETVAPAGRNLLEVAEEAGLCPPHGCRMGICHGCLTTLESGQVQDHASGERISTPGEAIRLCVCSAQSAVSLKL